MIICAGSFPIASLFSASVVILASLLKVGSLSDEVQNRINLSLSGIICSDCRSVVIGPWTEPNI